MSGVKLRGCGHCVPARVVTNDDLARRMDTSDAWILSLIHISEPTRRS